MTTCQVRAALQEDRDAGLRQRDTVAREMMKALNTPGKKMPPVLLERAKQALECSERAQVALEYHAQECSFCMGYATIGEGAGA